MLHDEVSESESERMRLKENRIEFRSFGIGKIGGNYYSRFCDGRVLHFNRIDDKPFFCDVCLKCIE